MRETGADFDRCPLAVLADERLVVLDVDRTIINTTSWYHACTLPGLLIDAARVEQFRALNDQAHADRSTLTDREFRLRTIDLINASGRWAWSAERLMEVGRVTGMRLRLYPEVEAYLRQLQQDPDGRARLVFLTSGYEAFMRGVVQSLLEWHLLADLPWDLIGSALDFPDGTWRLGALCDGVAKSRVVAQMLDAGAHIDLLADDDHHDQPMFALVEKAGGQVLRVCHQKAATRSESWRAHLSVSSPASLVRTDLTTSANTYGLADVGDLLVTHARCLKNLPTTDNDIGVGVMTEVQVTSAIERLGERAGSTHAAARLRQRLIPFLHCHGGLIHLRGRRYYLGAPPYLFPDHRTTQKRWKEVLHGALECLRLLRRTGVLAQWDSLSLPERWLVLCVADHLKNAATSALDQILEAALAGGRADRLGPDVEQVIQDCHLAYWSLVFNSPRLDVVEEITPWQLLERTVEQLPPAPFSIRELDDPRVIAMAVLSLAQQMVQAGEWPTGVIDFASGALDLGLAFCAITKLTMPHRPRVSVAHLAYSAKNIMRGVDEPGEFNLDALMYRIPRHHRQRVAHWVRSTGAVLLLDNNVTTFATLANVKRVLSRHATGQVRAAVACVNLDHSRVGCAGLT